MGGEWRDFWHNPASYLEANWKDGDLLTAISVAGLCVTYGPMLSQMVMSFGTANTLGGVGSMVVRGQSPEAFINISQDFFSPSLADKFSLATTSEAGGVSLLMKGKAAAAAAGIFALATLIPHSSNDSGGTTDQGTRSNVTVERLPLVVERLPSVHPSVSRLPAVSPSFGRPAVSLASPGLGDLNRFQPYPGSLNNSAAGFVAYASMAGGGAPAASFSQIAGGRPWDYYVDLRVPIHGVSPATAANHGPVAQGSGNGGIGFWDWAQGGLDVAGTFEPTPFCDLASAVIS